MAELKAYEKQITEQTFFNILNVFIGEDAEVAVNSSLPPNCQT